MTELRKFLNDTLDKSGSDKSVEDVVLFLQSNEWFGIKPVVKDDAFLLNDSQCSLLNEKLSSFFSHGGTDDILWQLFLAYPKTHGYLLEFVDSSATITVDERDLFYVADFLLYRLSMEIAEYTDKELSPLIEHATMDLTSRHGKILTFFLSWLRKHTKTRYHLDYLMEKRYTMSDTNTAYDMNDYLKLVYLLFNEKHAIETHMYERAADSVNMTDAWLFMSIHFICSIRMTDLERIYHPYLPYPPDEVIKRIRDNTFSANDARQTLLSITRRMCALPFTPNKTKRAKGIAPVKLHVPASCEVHFGKLFALAEAHRQLNGKADTPIIRKIATYREICRYMGDEIGSLFRESDFRARSVTKSYLQSVCILSDNILGDEKDGTGMKGYILAALARSHKGSYGEFAATTFEYIKDMKLSRLSPEYVAFELLERGAFSFITTMLLKVIGGDDYNKLSVHNQTKAHLALQLSPFEVDSVFEAVAVSSQFALEAVKEAIDSDEDIFAVLHRIASGQAFSKTAESMCLKTALKKPCPYNDRHCISCQYEISTKATMYLLIGELNRMKKLYKSVNSPAEKSKYKQLIQQVILPKMNEMLYSLKTDYGEELFNEFEKMIRENTL